MKLIRWSGVPFNLKKRNLGPLPGGRFFALLEVNDLPINSGGYHQIIGLDVLLSRGRVWFGDASNPSSEKWIEITPTTTLPTFQWERREREDKWGYPEQYFRAFPYMPEFYYVPVDTSKTQLFDFGRKLYA